MDNQARSKDTRMMLDELKVDERIGLTTKEVERRHEEYGRNEFTKPKKASLLQEIKKILSQQLIIILLIAAGISVLIREYQDAVGICLAVLLGNGIGLLTESRSKKAAESLAKMTEDIMVKVLRNHEKTTVCKSEIVPGDIVFLESGDMIPADGFVLMSSQLATREDMLTGESEDVSKKQGDCLYGGTFIASGSAKMIVSCIGDQTEMGHIAKELGDRETDTPLQIKLDELGRRISKISTAIAFILFVYMLVQILGEAKLTFQTMKMYGMPYIIEGFKIAFPSIKTAFIVCVALIVAAVPEGLTTMINITLAITMKQMAKINALVRKKEACETIGGVSVICSDKTGTLTQNRMKVDKLYIEGAYRKENEVSAYKEFIYNCIVNSTADIEWKSNVPKYIGSATECALLLLLKNYSYQSVRDMSDIVVQIPFESQNKYMLTMTHDPSGYQIFSKGAPEVILKQCSYEKQNKKVIPLTEARKQQILKEIQKEQDKAMRVIGFAHLRTTEKMESANKKLDKNLVFQGFVSISDPLREGVKEAIHIAREGGIETKILTGDNIRTAIAIGEQLGLLEDPKTCKAVEADYIEALSDEELQKEIKQIAIVARSKPTTKMRIVQALQKNGEVVAVTGDGINDAPALTKADVGIAMGIAGTEVSKNAADVILTDDSFGTIVEAIKWGRGIYNNFQRFIQFQLTVNIIAFLIAIISQVLDYPMPFTTIHLLWINIIMDGPPAIVLGLEPIRDAVMRRKPTSRKASIINQYMLVTIATNSLYITGVLYAQIKYNFLGASFRVIGAATEMQTVLFSLFAFLVLFNAFNCREFGIASIIPNFTKNKLALRIIGLTGAIQILMVQYVGGFFNAVPLQRGMWTKIVLAGASILVVDEVIKAVLRVFSKMRGNLPFENARRGVKRKPSYVIIRKQKDA
jgi:Ca2+-transporting ATPase